MINIKYILKKINSYKIYKTININLDNFLINKNIEIHLYKPNIILVLLKILLSFLLFKLVPYIICKICWFIIVLLLFKNIIKINNILLLFDFDKKDDDASLLQKIFTSIEFTNKVRFDFLVYSLVSFILLFISVFNTLLYYNVITFIGIVGIIYIYNKYKLYILNWIDDINLKKISKIIFCIIILIYIIDLIIVYKITNSVFQLFYLKKIYKNPLFFTLLLELYLNLRIDAKYKLISIQSYTFIWIILLIKSYLLLESGLETFLWLILSFVKYSYRYNLDIFFKNLKKNTTMDKAKEIAWNNADKLQVLIWSSIKSNIAHLINNPIEWYKSDGLTFQGLIDQVNSKEDYIMKSVEIFKKYKENNLLNIFSRYYFILQILIIFLTTIINCKLYSLEIYILPIIFISYIFNIYCYSKFTQIDIIDRLINIINTSQKYTNKKSNYIKKIIQNIYTTKSTAKGTCGGGIVGGLIGISTGSILSASLTYGGSLFGASLGGIYYGYKKSYLEDVLEEEYIDMETKKLRKYIEMKKKKENQDIKLIEMKEINKI